MSDTIKSNTNASDMPEGGIGDANHTSRTARAPRVTANPQDMFRMARSGLDSWLGLLPNGLAEIVRTDLTNRTDMSTRSVAQQFRDISALVWAHNAWSSVWGMADSANEIPIQREFNNKLWTYDGKGGFNHIISDDVVRLFPQGEPEKWPNIVFTSNHARAWHSGDLAELMEGQEALASDAFGKPLDIHRLEHLPSGAPVPDVAGKTIMLMAVHTEKDMFLNGANLIDRRLDLEEDPNKDSPEKRSVAHMSPAAMRLAKLMFKTMAEPASAPLIDLDRAQPRFMDQPYIADDVMRRGNEDVNYPEHHPIIMRADAAAIAQHFKGEGFSKGCSTVTDALRFMWLEYAKLGSHIKLRGNDGSLRDMTDNDMANIISNIALLTISPGEVPLTDAEKYKVGITRTTIHNIHDLTAGHLVNPDIEDYDPWSDRLIQVKGGYEEMGHSVVGSLGKYRQKGALMDPEMAKRDPNYLHAQDAIRAFYASCYHEQAITTLCVSHSAALKRNELYVQFAPGISRADEQAMKADLRSSFNVIGFAKAKVESDFMNRRRARIVLDNNTNLNIEHDVEILRRCKTGLKRFEETHAGHVLIDREAYDYLDGLAKAAAKPVLGAHTAYIGDRAGAAGHRR